MATLTAVDITKHILLDGTLGLTSGVVIDAAFNDVWDTFTKHSSESNLSFVAKIVGLITAQLFFDVYVGYMISDSMYVASALTDPTNGFLMLTLMFQGSPGLRKRIDVIVTLIRAQISKWVHNILRPSSTENGITVASD